MIRSLATIVSFAFLLVALSAASEPHLRTSLSTTEDVFGDEQGEKVMNVVVNEKEEGSVKGIDIKSTFDVEKSFHCKGSIDKEGATKNCEAGLKKKDSIGLYGLSPTDVAKDVASEVERLHDSVLPAIESFLPHDDVMAQIVEFVEDTNNDTMEDGSSMTVGFGGHFTAEWGCNVTYTKAVGKLTRIISCGVKSTEGSSMEGMGHDAVSVEHEKVGQEF